MQGDLTVPSRRRRVSLTGRCFGRWKVLRRATDSKRHWLCWCLCGAVRPVDHHTLISGKSRSCGCYRGEMMAEILAARIKHGLSRVGRRHPLYNTWRAMTQRCHNPAHHAYDRYGGRGITVCEEWRRSFPAFVAGVGDRPSARHTLDRIDNDRGYEPGNVRWATRREQQRNMRSNALLTFDGETRPLAEWMERLGVSEGVYRGRVRKGATPAVALGITAD